jgi:tRNA (cmo5U34)-methyltransferase
MENGVFILGDRIISKSDFINNLYVQRMKKAIKKVLKKLSEEERIIFDFIDKEEEMPTTLENYLRWLYEIGFQYIECLWREFNYVVLFARRGSVL